LEVGSLKETANSQPYLHYSEAGEEERQEGGRQRRKEGGKRAALETKSGMVGSGGMA